MFRGLGFRGLGIGQIRFPLWPSPNIRCTLLGVPIQRILVSLKRMEIVKYFARLENQTESQMENDMETEACRAL